MNPEPDTPDASLPGPAAIAAALGEERYADIPHLVGRIAAAAAVTLTAVADIAPTLPGYGQPPARHEEAS